MPRRKRSCRAATTPRPWYRALRRRLDAVVALLAALVVLQAADVAGIGVRGLVSVAVAGAVVGLLAFVVAAATREQRRQGE